MKHLRIVATAVVASIFALPGPVNAYVSFKSLGGKNIGDTSYWPEGLKELVLRHKCVAGLETIAPSWSRGIIAAQLCFTGDQAQFNAFLKAYAKVKRDPLILTLHPGKGAFHAVPVKAKEPVSFDWQVSVSMDGLFNRDDGAKATTHLSVQYYLGDRADLKGLEVPPNVQVAAGYDDKLRQAHNDDPTLQAIDAFVRLRKNRKPGE